MKYIKECWASLYNDRAIFYRREKHFDERNISIAVVVQCMVSAQKAGVMFTSNPITNDYDTVVLEAAWGLGEAIVSGIVTPDNLWINKHTDVRKSITVILAMSSVSVAMMVSFKSVLPFMASALVYYTFNAITVPVLQVMMMKDEDKNQAGTISGLYNAFWALGRTVGPLIAAFVYGINPLYPFMLAAAVYMLAAVLSIWNRFQYKNRKPRLVTE